MAIGEARTERLKFVQPLVDYGNEQLPLQVREPILSASRDDASHSGAVMTSAAEPALERTATPEVAPQEKAKSRRNLVLGAAAVAAATVGFGWYVTHRGL